MCPEHIDRLQDSYNSVLLAGQMAIMSALDQTHVLNPERRESFVHAIDTLDHLYRGASGGRPPKPYYFFPVGPPPNNSMACSNCGSSYNYEDATVDWTRSERRAGHALQKESGQNCCGSPSIPGLERWVGMWCILCLQQYFPSRHNYTRHPLRCPSCAKRYANRERQRRHRAL